jgi:hypothetical protein
MNLMRFACQFIVVVAVAGNASVAATDERPQPVIQRGSLFTNTVAWYHPAPASLDSARGRAIPPECFIWVNSSRRKEAFQLLEKESAVEISQAKAAEFAGEPINMNAIIEGKIIDLEKQLRRVGDRVGADRDYKLMRLSDEEIRSKSSMERRFAQQYRAEIRGWRQWKNHLRPYLVRAVALKAGGTFRGVLISDILVVGHNAMGGGPAPMEKCPVLVYLPTKPKQIYTSVSMTR